MTTCHRLDPFTCADHKPTPMGDLTSYFADTLLEQIRVRPERMEFDGTEFEFQTLEREAMTAAVNRVRNDRKLAPLTEKDVMSAEVYASGSSSSFVTDYAFACLRLCSW